MLVVNEREEALEALHLPTGPFISCSLLEPETVTPLVDDKWGNVNQISRPIRV